MDTPQTHTTGNANGLVAILLPCLLIGSFVWKVLIPAHEFPMRTLQVMTMTFDLIMLMGLFALKRSMPAPLFWLALAAGIGLFALRLSHDGWWTGHLTYSIPSR